MNLNTHVRMFIEHMKCNENVTKGRLHVRFIWNEIGQTQWKTNGYDNVINGVCNRNGGSGSINLNTNGNGTLSIERMSSLGGGFELIVLISPSCSHNYIHCLAYSWVCVIFLRVPMYLIAWMPYSSSRQTHIFFKEFNVGFSCAIHVNESMFLLCFNLCSLTRVGNELLKYR